jgi:hypothetical protein
MNVTVNKDILEKEIQRVFKKLPGITTDTASLIYIMDALDKKFEADFGSKISTDY